MKDVDSEGGRAMNLGVDAHDWFLELLKSLLP
jgi:hypothetical protein